MSWLANSRVQRYIYSYVRKNFKENEIEDQDDHFQDACLIVLELEQAYSNVTDEDEMIRIIKEGLNGNKRS